MRDLNWNLQHKVKTMPVRKKFGPLGYSLWLDSLTRDLLYSGKLKTYLEKRSVSGLEFNPVHFQMALKNSKIYDAAILNTLMIETSGEELLYEIVLEDLKLAADLLRPIYDRSEGRDGWASLEVSPLLAFNTAAILSSAEKLYSRARRPNLFIKVPGTQEGLSAVEEAIFMGIPVNVTLLFSWGHYQLAANAFMRGLERRIDAGLKPNVYSIASILIGAWDTGFAGREPQSLAGQLGLAVAKRSYKALTEVLSSPRWKCMSDAGAKPQRILWSGIGAGRSAADTFYINALTAPFLACSLSEEVLIEMAGEACPCEMLPADGGNCDSVLARFALAGIDVEALADQLQQDSIDSLIKSWIELMNVIASKSAALWQLRQ